MDNEVECRMTVAIYSMCRIFYMYKLIFGSLFTPVAEEQGEGLKKSATSEYEWKEVKRRSRSNSLRRDDKVCNSQ